MQFCVGGGFKIKEKETDMKVLLLNGSPHAHGCTYTALKAVADVLEEEGIETEILQIGTKPVQDCIACGGCYATGKCVFQEDGVNEWIEKAASADGFVFGTPVYYAHPTGRVLAALDRLFYAGGEKFSHKPAAVVASARRTGTIVSLDAVEKHLTINEMPVVSSTYWNEVHGHAPEDVLRDEEGMQTMRNLGRNMAWLLKCIEAGRKVGIAVPKTEHSAHTNFIR